MMTGLLKNQINYRNVKAWAIWGSFDPIHHGHLILARQALEDLSLDRVIFIPGSRVSVQAESLQRIGRRSFGDGPAGRPG